MTNVAVIENKISAARKYLATLAAYQQYPRKEIEADMTIRGAVERYLYLAVQATIDLAEAIIAYKSLRKPATMGEAFQILAEAHFIPDDLRDKLVRMTGFRNVIAHDYEEIDYEVVYDVLTNRLPDIQAFLDIVAKIR